MGLFDKLRGNNRNEAAELTEREAIAAVVLVTVASDGEITEEETHSFVDIIGRLKLYDENVSGSYERLVEKLFGILHQEGPNRLLEKAASSMSQEPCETAFAIAADLIFADGYVSDQEKQVLDEIQATLRLPEDVALKILDVTMMKYRIP